MNLFVLLVVPLVSAIGLLLVPATRAKWIALLGAIAQVVATIALVVAYEAAQTAGSAFLFEQKTDLFKSFNIRLHVAVDGVSVAMIALTALVVLAGVLVSWRVQKMTKEFYFLLFLLSLGAYGVFISLDFFVLFFFLEVAVIPKYLLIGIWGSGKKEYSANKLALLLMLGSSLVLVGLLGMYFSAAGGMGSFDLLQVQLNPLPVAAQQVFFPFLFAGFGIFSALFPFHTWVPDGHSSAPTAGSMFLAGISMKLGGYGCLRVATHLMPEGAKEYATIIIVLSSIAILYGAFATMMQKDLKYINAYSSVSHCGFVLLGIGMMTRTSITGAVMQMVSHGLMTALFFAVIGMVYERTHTRMVADLGGLMKVMPFTMTVFFLAALCSLGLPGLSGFAAEVTVFMGSWERSGTFYRVSTIVACLSIVVTAVYILRAVGQTAMGPLKQRYVQIGDAAWNERLAAVILVAGIIAIGVAPSWLSRLIEQGFTVTSTIVTR